MDALLARLEPGDVVRFDRGEYAHVALYAGDGRVVHLWSPESSSSFRVRVDPLRAVALAHGASSATPECFSAQMDARLDGAEPLPGDEVVRRALSKLGAREYDYLAYNCEHFVTWARYGAEASPQVASQANRVLAGALLGAAVGGLAGFVAGGVLSLFLRADALAASVGASGGSAGGASAFAGDDVANEAYVRELQRHADSEMRASNSEEDDGDDERAGGDTRSCDHGSDAQRAAERARLWVEMDAIRPTAALREQSDELTQLDEWVEERRRRAAAASSRRYSTARHVALATRLAEDELQCGCV